MYINKKGEFIIENYQKGKTFSSFLSGIAGKFGIPMWVFYVNRGQGIASFGIENKDNAILEFLPANKSYQTVQLKGFRTFIKYIDENASIKIYEPFRGISPGIKSRMIITPYSLKIEEVNQEEQLAIEVKYFVLPGEDFPSLVRRLVVKNLVDEPRKIEILDGLPEIIPYGLSNIALKEVSQTMSAWCRVYNLENKMPFYRIKASTDDSPEVRKLEKGHFYLAFTDEETILTPLVDPQIIFGEDTAFLFPDKFLNIKLAGYQKNQLGENRFPSAMAACEVNLEGGSSVTINSLFGHVSTEDKLDKIKNKVVTSSYLDEKERECQLIHQEITDTIFTKSNYPVFDYYCRQTYLDNILRGGFPVNISNIKKKTIHYIYSRKHGDLERDYNFFHLEASYYSQGNGNYRDINQNRRCDNFFNVDLEDYNIKVFANLIQADGFNPLVIKGTRYFLEEEALAKICKYVRPEDEKIFKEKLKEPFTPGELLSFILDYKIKLDIGLDEFIEKVAHSASSMIDAEFGEGYRVDHWTYLLDLIETYLAIYPDRLRELLLEDKSYYFHDSYMRIKPRSEKYLLTDQGPRQLDSIEEVIDKRKLIEARETLPYCLRTENGKGEIYRNNLLVKLLTLVTNKVSSLDPYGIAIEMEANKPGWYDALNGLPGIFGSSTPETMELKRLVDFLLEKIDDIGQDFILNIPVELLEFIEGIRELISIWMDKRNNYQYWDKASTLRERYREKVFYGFSGKEEDFSVFDLKDYLKNISQKLEYAFGQVAVTGYNLYSTYYYHIPIEYEETGEYSEEGYPYIRINKFEQVILPPFLEGQVRAMKILDKDSIRELHEMVKKSELFDSKLKMYRLNGDLSGMPDDIGRARAFTPGWLENGSIWLHMEYKYLLELIKKGLYEEFFQAMKDCLIPFQDPEIYGRSILENSSFIMSSSNPDTDNHGRGYVARLSGSTAEFLNIWIVMVFGTNPFKIGKGKLIFKPEPVLKGDFFTTGVEEVEIYLAGKLEKFLIPENAFACCLFGKTLIVYHNPARKDTYNTKIEGFKLTMDTGEVETINRCELDNLYAESIRDGRVKKIDIYLS